LQASQTKNDFSETVLASHPNLRGGGDLILNIEILLTAINKPDKY
jgi:hypothetical protein